MRFTGPVGFFIGTLPDWTRTLGPHGVLSMLRAVGGTSALSPSPPWLSWPWPVPRGMPVPYPCWWLMMFFCPHVLYAICTSGFGPTHVPSMLPVPKGDPGGSSSTRILLWGSSEIGPTLVGYMFPVQGGSIYGVHRASPPLRVLCPWDSSTARLRRWGPSRVTRPMTDPCGLSLKVPDWGSSGQPSSTVWHFWGPGHRRHPISCRP